VVANLEKLSISPDMTEDDAARSMSFFGDFNGNMLGVVYFSGETPWECHPAGDELLYVLEGEIDLTILSADERQREVVGAGWFVSCRRVYGTDSIRSPVRSCSFQRLPKAMRTRGRTIHGMMPAPPNMALQRACRNVTSLAYASAAHLR
jgi:hypothetical protein